MEHSPNQEVSLAGLKSCEEAVIQTPRAEVRVSKPAASKEQIENSRAIQRYSQFAGDESLSQTPPVSSSLSEDIVETRPSELCSTCAAFDLRRAFNADEDVASEPDDSQDFGTHIAELKRTSKDLIASNCPMCKLFASTFYKTNEGL